MSHSFILLAFIIAQLSKCIKKYSKLAVEIARGAAATIVIYKFVW